MRKFDYFLIEKNSPSPANEFLLHSAGALVIIKSNKKLIFKNCTSPANEFLVHKCRNNRKINLQVQLMSFSYIL